MPSARLALITGGGSGIGRAVAHAFARDGVDVVIADIDPEAAASVAGEVEALGASALGISCDVADEASVIAAVAAAQERFGRIDALVTSAGVDLHKDLEGTTLEGWQRVLAINLTGTFLFMKHVRPLMVANRHGRIVCLGSSSGVYGMGWPSYSTSKAALHGLALSAARELAPLGVTVNVVVPGPTETPLSLELWRNNPGRRERLEASVPVGRVARPEEIAGAIVYLAGENAGFVTGSSLTIDGGLTSLMRVQNPLPAG